MNIDWKYPFFEAGRGSVWPKISGRRGSPPLSETRQTDFSYGVRMSAELSFFFHKFTRLTDRQADGQTALRSLRPRCIQYSAVMSVH